ncbi:MAG: WD40 repeat domain-containing protein [Cyanobacteria bacterium J007]|nr:MAG: WD40 repeat domain-containing protein [Cyanobacteria bacterium J007]
MGTVPLPAKQHPFDSIVTRLPFFRNFGADRRFKKPGGSRGLLAVLTLSAILAGGAIASVGAVDPTGGDRLRRDGDLSAIAASWQNPERVTTLEGESNTVESVAFSPDGTILAVGGGRNDPRIELWNLENNKRFQTLKGHKNRVLELDFTPDGRTLVSSGDDAIVNLWNLETGKLKHTFLDHFSNVVSLAITPDSHTLVSGALDGLKLWDLLDPQPLDSVWPFQPIYSVAISPDGTLLAVGDREGAIALWPLQQDGEAIRFSETIATPFRHEAGITSLAFSPDGRRLVSAGLDRAIHVWNLQTGQLDAPSIRTRSPLRSLALNPVATIAATTSREGIQIWNLTDATLLAELSEDVTGVVAIAWSPDGERLATGGLQRTIEIWHGGSLPGSEVLATTDANY